MLWRRYTLLCVLIITSLPLMIIGWTGRSGLYSEYELTLLTKPALALVMEGIHDGVYPWQSLIKPEGRVEETDEAATEEIAAFRRLRKPCFRKSGDPAARLLERQRILLLRMLRRSLHQGTRSKEVRMRSPKASAIGPCRRRTMTL